MNEKIIRKYCIGCGLCKSAGSLPMEKNGSGYLTISSRKLDSEAKKFIHDVCPTGDENLKRTSSRDIWGTRLKTVFSWANDKDVRRIASSGGILTAMAIFLLETNRVDGIIHTKVSDESVIENEVHISTCKEDVLHSAGSRYSPSSPLKNIFQIIDKQKRYAFIGKPCDVSALRNCLEIMPDYKDCITFMFSFFCAGLPSRKANENLLLKLNTSEKDCQTLTYRGNGWPGEATALKKDGTSSSMSYEKAWGGILGRDVHPFCRFCMDGTGERADISCGDGWYLKENGEPSFEESEGRNIVFLRTEKGRQVFFEALAEGYISCDDNVTDEYLKKVQKYQYSRKACMKYKMLAHGIMFKDSPYNKISSVSAFARYAENKEKWKFFIGTVKRIVKGKI